MPEAAQHLLRTKEAAEYVGVQERTLEQWRYKRRGPRFIRLPGSKAVRYDPRDLKQFIEQGRLEADAPRTASASDQEPGAKAQIRTPAEPFPFASHRSLAEVDASAPAQSDDDLAREVGVPERYLRPARADRKQTPTAA